MHILPLKSRSKSAASASFEVMDFYKTHKANVLIKKIKIKNLNYCVNGFDFLFVQELPSAEEQSSMVQMGGGTQAALLSR